MEYILGPKEPGCIFCFDPKQDTERLVLRRESHAFVILNKYPYTGGHLMVVPTLHECRLGAFEPNVWGELCELVRRSSQAVEKTLNPDGLNVGMNLGRVAGAGVDDHLHFHIVPRWNGDTNFMPVLGHVRVMNQYLEETYQQLKPAFAW